MNAPSHDTRLHALDAVRGFALLLGVVLHAAMSYLPGFDVMWPLADKSPSEALGVTFFVIHIFRMTLFFVLAGFFARMVFHRRGMRAFIRERATRIVLPLVVGWVVLFPMIAATMVWGAVPGRTLTRPPASEMPLLPFPLTHLWFLYVLVLLYTAVLVVRQGVIERVDRGGALRHSLDGVVRVLITPGGPLALAVPLTLALLAVGSWHSEGGIPTPDNSLIPNLPAITAFGTAFTFGWLLQRQLLLLQSLQRWWAPQLALAIGLTVVCRATLGPPQIEAEQASSIPIYLACYTVATWSWTFGLIGAALRFCSSGSAVRRYLADASYWVYLAHLPVVFFLQALVAQQPWHWALKFPLVLGVSLAFLFATYHVFVRRTFIGVILNGRRHGGAPAASVPAADVTAHVVDGGFNRPIAQLSQVRKTFGPITALDGLSLDVRPGEILAVLGPNGAGKSTAISLLLGLQEPTEGTATLFDRPPANLEARYPVGVMMQEASLAPELKVRELIALTTSYYPSPYTVEEVLTLTRTTAIANRPYQKLSGGQKRLAQFALALCGRPSLLFLDEPTVGLDAAARDMLWSTLRQVVAQGTAVVLTTHYLEEAEALADRVAVLAKGRLIAHGSVDEVRSVVDRKRVRCLTGVPAEEVRRWPGVQSAAMTDGRLEVVATDADGVVRRLFIADEQTRDLEVQRAGLAEAFAELTREAA